MGTGKTGRPKEFTAVCGANHTQQCSVAETRDNDAVDSVARVLTHDLSLASLS
jgi:hypothetical protein